MNNEILETALNWRYAVKRFDPSRKISNSDWKSLRESLLKAPSSFGLQPWKFFVIESPALREQLKAVSWNQTQVTDASHYVVFAAKESVTDEDIEKYLKLTAETRGLSMQALQGFKDMLTGFAHGALADKTTSLGWAQRQTYIALGFLLEAAALLNIDATPMEGFDPAAYGKLLKLEGTGYQAVVSAALGYRHADDSFQQLKKVRRTEADVIRYL